jgi:dephospho-CoA kinase
MFIAIVGTPSSGKRSVLRYLVEKHGFIQLGLEKPSDEMAGAELVSVEAVWVMFGLHHEERGGRAQQAEVDRRVTALRPV